MAPAAIADSATVKRRSFNGRYRDLTACGQRQQQNKAPRPSRSYAYLKSQTINPPVACQKSRLF
jgi:hypothetical protein